MLIKIRTTNLYIFIFIWISLYICVESDEDPFSFSAEIEELIETTTASPSTTPTFVKEIENITCIADKYGLGYVGIQNTTYDGTPCVEWSRNLLLYTRYKLRGKNITENYCRNPDGDSSGPWCFVANRSVFKKHFKFKHCGVPLCKGKLPEERRNISVGIPMLIERECPTGFEERKFTMRAGNQTSCQVKQEYLSKLPRGDYSFKLLEITNSTFCPESFSNEVIGSQNLFCTKADSLNNTIEFPDYLMSPKHGELIFLAIKFGLDAICPKMSPQSSFVIRKPLITLYSKEHLTVCYYFFMSYRSTKKYMDRKLELFVLKPICPKDWVLKYKPINWSFNLKLLTSYKRKEIYMCRPLKDVYDYPDGDYCLFSRRMSTYKTYQCPEDFIDVNLKIHKENYIKFCCRQAQKPAKEIGHIFNYFNVTTMLAINSEDKCVNVNDKRNITTSSYYFESSVQNVKYDCLNCDLFSVFKTYSLVYATLNFYFRIKFKACNYEQSSSGFAYISLSSRCPPNMQYGFIRYSKTKFSYPYIPTVTVSFCTVVNYPKNISFPDGRYCIYKLGLECPNGFREVITKVPIYVSKYTNSGGDASNFQLNTLCCKYGSPNITFDNVTLPYVTPNFEFGLPYANENFKCIHGLETHTAVEDSHMCNYYPTTEALKKLSIVFPSNDCGFRVSRFFGAYRMIYSARILIRYCMFYVNNKPPLGDYCAPFFKSCPPHFYYVTYHPLLTRAICCRKPASNSTLSTESEYSAADWTSELKSFSLLAYKKKCPIFRRYNYGKEPIKRYYFYTANDIGVNHKVNLTSIGFEVNNNNLKGFTVAMYSCDYKLDPYNKSVTWPHGQYAFPRPLSGCPSNFKTGNFTHSMETVNPSFAHSDTIHLDGDYMIGGSVIKWGFCVKKDNYIKERLFLPYGRYCLLKVGFACASGFSEGSVKFVEITALHNMFIKKEGVLPKIDTDGPFITYHFCCQSARGDVAHEPIYLPTESGSFYLLKFGSYCQRVHGMRFTEEYICIDSEDTSQYLNYTFQAPYKVEGSTPVTGSFVRGCDFQINLCYYELDIPVQKPATQDPVALVSWPKGSYVYIKQLNKKCIDGFEEGTVTVQTFFKFHPKFMNILMFGSQDENNAIFSFCKRNIANDTKPAENWPPGNYCIIFEKKCPQGMLRHKLRSVDHFISKRQSGAYMSEWSNLCCKKDGPLDSKHLTYFPGDYYTIIIQPSLDVHTCPPHQNARVALIDLQNEILCYYERSDESVEFPDGDYFLPPIQKPMNSCAPGFKLVEHRHVPLNKNDKSVKSLTLCHKENTNYTGQSFPRGNYCVLTKDYKCPSSQFTLENMLSIPMYHFADELNRFSRYLACCQRDDKIISNLKIEKTPFQLFSSSPCSFVEGLISVQEVEEPTILVQQSEIEKPPYNRKDKKIRLCKYEIQSVWNFETRCQCHADATCYLSYDDKNCHCKSGYYGDGKLNCTKITNLTDNCADTCDKKLSTCKKVTPLNSYRCVCNEGYEGDGVICKPSCKTRNCNVFSQCVVDSIESHCACLKGNVEVESGKCHGDLINTIYHLNGFDLLSQLNLSCFSKDAYDHLVLPLTTRTLFIFYPMNETDIFSNCERAGNYYGFTYAKTFTWKDYYNLEIDMHSGKVVTVILGVHNNWTIGSLPIINRQLFSNAVVVYLNTTDFESSDPQNSPYRRRYNDSYIIVYFVLGGIPLMVLVVLLIFLINGKRPMFSFNRFYQTRSESNIHFISAEDHVEIDS